MLIMSLNNIYLLHFIIIAVIKLLIIYDNEFFASKKLAEEHGRNDARRY